MFDLDDNFFMFYFYAWEQYLLITAFWFAPAGNKASLISPWFKIWRD